MKRPELLSPAGGPAKLKTAISYGADAVYLAGQAYGLRAAADNFTPTELREGVAFAHQAGSKAYVVLNSFFHDEDFHGLDEFLGLLEEVQVDAVIVSDLGVISEVRSKTTLDIHLSTQASCLNSMSALAWREQGVSRIVLGRETSLLEAKKIKKETGLELEMFIHGSMCMAYSGHCTISNFTAGRDSNRGGCAHSCRFEYQLRDKNGESEHSTFFMSSKDLSGLMALPQYIEAGIDSLKVEGRMKGHLYAATVSKIYKEALDYHLKHESFQGAPFELWSQELSSVSGRSATETSLLSKSSETPGAESVYQERDNNELGSFNLGHVLQANEKGVVVEVRHTFNASSSVELIEFKGPNTVVKVDQALYLDGRPVQKANPGDVVIFPPLRTAKRWQLLRGQL